MEYATKRAWLKMLYYPEVKENAFMRRWKKMKRIMIVICVIAILFGFVYGVYYRIERRNFFNAIDQNDVDEVHRILERFPSLANSTPEPVFTFFSYEASTSFTYAIRKHGDNLELIKCFVEHGADVNKAPLSLPGKEYANYPILEALFYGYYDVAWYLIEHGADVCVKNGVYTAPQMLFRGGCDTEDDKRTQFDLFVYMVEQGVSLEPYGAYDSTPFLILPAVSGNEYIMEYLLTTPELEIDINAVDFFEGHTALMEAVQKQHYEMCELLLKHGADTSIQDKNGKTAYDYAVELGDQRLIDMLSQ